MIIRKQYGLSLVELLIALAISAGIITGIIQVFLSNRTAYNLTESSIRVQENGRFALEFIANTIRGSGSYGCLPDFKTGRGNIVSHITSFTDMKTIQTGAIADIGSTSDGAAVSGSFDAPDSLTLLIPTDNSAIVTAVTEATATDPAKLSVASGGNFFKNQYVLVSNCLVGDFIELDTNSTDSLIVDATDSLRTDFYKPLNIVNTVTEVNVLKYSVDTTTNTLQSTLYTYSATGGVETDTQDLIDGVENIQFEYGVDTDGDGTPEYYDSITNVRARNTADHNYVDDIIAIKIYVLSVGDSQNVVTTPQTITMAGDSITSGDRLLRKVFEKTVAVRNRIK